MKDAIPRDTFVIRVEKEGSEVDAAHGCSDAEVRDGGLLERYVHLGVTAGCRCIHSGYNPFNIAAQSGPLLIADNHEGDFSGFKVLLETDVFVSYQRV